jgi:hypothetical protein
MPLNALRFLRPDIFKFLFCICTGIHVHRAQGDISSVPYIVRATLIHSNRRAHHTYGCVAVIFRRERGKITQFMRSRNLQLGYLEVTVQEKLRSGWPRPFVKVEGCCD